MVKKKKKKGGLDEWKLTERILAAKTKIMNLYNQFMAGPSNNQQRQGGGVLETGMGNLSLSDNQPPQQQQRGRSVDLYEWDGKAI
jgi:hypothetical protein